MQPSMEMLMMRIRHLQLIPVIGKERRSLTEKNFHIRDCCDKRDDRPSSSRSKDRRDYLKVQCFRCKELGHIMQDFPKEKGK